MVASTRTNVFKTHRAQPFRWCRTCLHICKWKYLLKPHNIWKIHNLTSNTLNVLKIYRWRRMRCRHRSMCCRTSQTRTLPFEWIYNDFVPHEAHAHSVLAYITFCGFMSSRWLVRRRVKFCWCTQNTSKTSNIFCWKILIKFCTNTIHPLIRINRWIEMPNSHYGGCARAVQNIPEKFNLRNRNEQSFLSILFWNGKCQKRSFALSTIPTAINYFSCLVRANSCQNNFN